MKIKYLKWTVEFSVHPSWVKDGFNLTDEQAFRMLENRIPYAYGYELEAKVIKTPSSDQIRIAEETIYN